MPNVRYWALVAGRLSSRNPSVRVQVARIGSTDRLRIADVACAAPVRDTKPMHPFPDASKLRFLVGNQLEQICLGQWQIQFVFDKARILVEGGLEHVADDGTVRQHNTEEDRLAPLFLPHLLGQQIRLIESEPFQLTLGFNGGDLVRIFSNDGPFECGQVYDEHGALTVF